MQLSQRDAFSFLSAVSCCCSSVREVATEDRAVEVVVESVSVWTMGGGFVELGLSWLMCWLMVATEVVSMVRSLRSVTEFRQPLQVQIHLEMPGILVQLGHIQRT